MREFQYDITKLIELVEERPCLWDKSLESYKDRLERRTAWEEIFHLMDERYDAMLPEEKRITGEHILNKWTNVRDTFVKTLKHKMGRPRKRYILHEHLKFLTKNLAEEECNNMEYTNDASVYMKQQYARGTQSVSPRKKTKRNNTEDSSTDYESSHSSYVPNKKSKKSDHSTGETQRKREQNELNVKSDAADIDFIEVDGANDPRLMNEDEAFFASLLPTVAKYSEDERLEFRLEVLGVMKRVKDKRNWPADDNNM